MQQNVIFISDCPITDSIFDIKKSLEEPTICRVQKMFSVPNEYDAASKQVFILVEWGNTKASEKFSLQLRENYEKKLFKLDSWDLPISWRCMTCGVFMTKAAWPTTCPG